MFKFYVRNDSARESDKENYGMLLEVMQSILGEDTVQHLLEITGLLES
jgi:hypothetical protein